MTTKAWETARRNLRQRIKQMLGEEQRVIIPAWQAGMVLLAIEQLQAGDFDTGERTVMKAERPDMWQWSNPIEGAVPHRRTDLIKILEEALKAD
jgi:hypothetical protein